MDEIETTNINIKWLENIYQELRIIQDMERIAREGCKNLMEYFEIPFNMHRIILPDAQYKNMRFMALELDILISNIAPVIKNEKQYRGTLNAVLKNMNKRELFLKEYKKNGQIIMIETLPILGQTINYLSGIRTNIIKDIKDILYIKEGENKKTW